MLDVRLLMDLGLTPKEAEIVVHMANALKAARRGYFEAPALAKEVGIPREKIYTYLKGLEERGVLEATGGRPKTVSLRPIDEVLDRLEKGQRERLEVSLSQLSTKVQDAKKAEYASLLPRISVLKDNAQYLETMIDMISKSARAMIIARTSAVILPWPRSGEPPDLLETYRNTLIDRASTGGIQVDYFIPFDYTRAEILRRSTQSTVDARRAVANLREFCIDGKHPNITVRNMPGIPAISLIIADGKVAVGFSSEEEARTAKGTLVESKDFFEFMSSVYDLLVSQAGGEITSQMVEEIEDALQKAGRARLDAAVFRERRADHQTS